MLGEAGVLFCCLLVDMSVLLELFVDLVQLADDLGVHNCIQTVLKERQLNALTFSGVFVMYFL